jgi:hypothetical protein
MTQEEAIAIIDDEETLLFYDNCDDALVGVGARCSCPPVAIYSYEKLVDVFIAGGMDREESVEWIDFNVLGGWIGPQTPMVIMDTPRS